MQRTPRTSFRHLSWRLLLPLALAAGCGSVAEPESDQDASVDSDAAPQCTSPTPGKFTREVLIDGVSREVIVYVPEMVAAQAPAVFMFHGSTGTGEKFYQISAWKEKADETGLIAVFPSALVHCFYDTKDLRYKTQTKWSGGKFGTEHLLCTPEELAKLSPTQRELADHPEADDIGFVNAMIDMLATDYCVDSNRVYSAGFSNGAGFSGRVGLEISHRIAAFAMSSGAPVVDSIATRPISAMLNFGDDESELPMDESAWGLPAFQELLGRALPGLELTDAYTYDEPTIAGVNTAQFTFTTSIAGHTNTFQSLIIEGLAHQYANGTNHPIRMADVHWDFFSLHTLDEND